MDSDLGKVERKETRSLAMADSANTSREEANGSNVFEVVG